MSSLTAYKFKLLAHPRAKAFLHRVLLPANDFRPRWWVRTFVNPFFHTRRGIIRRKSRLDLVPYNDFTLRKRAIVEDLVLINNVVGDVTIGEASLIGVGSVLIGPVHVEKDVLLAQHVVVSALNHGYLDIHKAIRLQPIETAKITIAEGSWIGAHAIILPGIRVGKNSVVAAGSVVTKNVPDYCVVVGNPARIVRQYNAESAVWEKQEAIEDFQNLV